MYSAEAESRAFAIGAGSASVADAILLIVALAAAPPIKAARKPLRFIGHLLIRIAKGSPCRQRTAKTVPEEMNVR